MILHGDSLELIASMDADSIDAVVCDPPYGIGFMGKAWDGAAIATAAAERGTNHLRRPAMHSFQVWCEQWATECLRVLKPGGHLLAFGGTRTYHRLAAGIEDAGFEIRDTLAWLYGSGFPKSLDVSRAIDRTLGADPIVTGPHPTNSCPGGEWCKCDTDGRAFSATVHAPATAAATDAAQQWQGWGTALKPAYEPIVVARKPLSGTVAGTVLQHGTGAINVDGCRIDGEPDAPGTTPATLTNDGTTIYGKRTRSEYAVPSGRWPANVLLDEPAAAILDEQAPNTGGGGFCGGGIGDGLVYGSPGSGQTRVTGRVDANGGASRFFYVAKTSSSERNAGLDTFPMQTKPTWSSGEQNPGTFQSDGTAKEARNVHPTVKPVDVMRWLVRLVTPPGGTVLDPFTGSGTTGIAAHLEGFEFVGCEREAEYVAIAEARIAWWKRHADAGADTTAVVAVERDPAQIGLFDEAVQ